MAQINIATETEAKEAIKILNELGYTPKKGSYVNEFYTVHVLERENITPFLLALFLNRGKEIFQDYNPQSRLNVDDVKHKNQLPGKEHFTKEAADNIKGLVERLKRPIIIDIVRGYRHDVSELEDI